MVVRRRDVDEPLRLGLRDKVVEDAHARRVVHRLHAHIWVTFTHYSQIQVNSNMLQWISRRLYNSKLPANLQKKDSGCSITRLPYVHVKLLPQSDWATIMRQYIHKAMTD